MSTECTDSVVEGTDSVVKGTDSVVGGKVLEKTVETKASNSFVVADASLQNHNAGYDSYATGMILACYKLYFNTERFTEMINKVYLMGQSHPLLLYKSDK